MTAILISNTTFIFRVLTTVLISVLAAGWGGALHAKKIYVSQCGIVYLNSGETIVADDTLNLRLPKKKEKPAIIARPYTAENRIVRRLEPAAIDSIVAWSRTAPERTHTFVYLDGRGWCHQAERADGVAVLLYASKGYRCSGNGGLWFYGKGDMILVKEGVAYSFGQPHKKFDKKKRARLEALFSGDSARLEYIRRAEGRCDKVLRGLCSISD